MRFILQSEPRACEWSMEDEIVALAVDFRELPCSRISGDLAELHPDEIIEPRVEPFDDLLKNRETHFLAVIIKPRPVSDHDRGLAPGDDFRQSASLRIGSDELVDRASRQTIPSAKPIASATDDRDNASWVGAVEIRGILDPRGDALFAFKDVSKVMRDLRFEDISTSLERPLRQFRENAIAEPSGSGYALARISDVLEYLERIGHVPGKLID